jgi:amino acid adenylation domain-containing protein
VPRSTAHTPLFQVMLTTNTDYGIENQSQQFSLPDVAMTPMHADTQTSKFDLEINLQLTPAGININCIYDTALFSHQHIAGFSEHLSHLLTGLAKVDSAANTLVSNLPMLSQTETEYLLHQLNDMIKTDAVDTCLHQAFEAQVMAKPEAIALVCGQQQLTYKELNNQANQLANYLSKQHQITAGNQIGLCVERSLDMVIGLLAIQKAGGAYVAIDTNAPASRINYMISDANLKLVLTRKKQATKFLPHHDLKLVVLDDSDKIDLLMTHSAEDLKITKLNTASLAYINYTSGSTGQPKGVQVTNQNVSNLAYAMQEILAERGLVGNFKWAWNAPLVFDASVQALTQLAFGVELHLLTEEMRTDPGALASYIESAEIDMLDTTPSLAELLVKECQSRDIELPSMLIGGEAMPTELWSTLAQYYQQHESFALNVYGPTECTVNSTFADIEVNSKPNIGRGLPNVSLYVMNNAQQLLPVGAKGELYIGGEGVTAGYINNPELNAASFIDSDEFGRLYKSGDLVRWNHSGQLEFIGRSDFQVKLRGYRIELEEIENIALQHPIVDEVAVLVKDQQLVAYLVPDQAHESHIKSFLETRLPAYMVPSHIVMLAEMPVTANGKRDRKALLSIDVSTDTTTYLPPETKMELAVQAIWSELLGQDNISVDANFFEIGGHSLLGIRLASACRERLGVELPLKVLMEGPTIRCLAEQCDWYEKQRQVLACADQLSNEREDSERIVI